MKPLSHFIMSFTSFSARKNPLFEPMRVSVMLPAYNEGDTMEEAIKRVEEVFRRASFDL